MLALLAATIIATGQEPVARYITLPDPNSKVPRLTVYVREVPLDPPKFSPKLFGDPAQRWQFDWVASSFGPDPDAPRETASVRDEPVLEFFPDGTLRRRFRASVTATATPR